MPWQVENVSLDPVKKTVEIYFTHEKGSKLLCPVCRRDCKVYDHLHERIWMDLDSIEFMTFIHASPPSISCPDHNIIERAVKRCRERKTGHPSIIGKDEKSYKKGHRYITIVYDIISCFDYIAYDRKIT